MFQLSVPLRTEDIDTITSINEDVQEIIDELGVDINNDALDYVYLYDDCTFLTYGNYQNIEIEYLDVPDTIKTKMNVLDDPDKMTAFAGMLSNEVDSVLTVQAICDYLEDVWSYDTDSELEDIIEQWLESCVENEILYFDNDSEGYQVY